MNPDKMSSTKTTPDERAEKRLERLDKETAQISIDKYDSFATRGAYRNGFATCIREEVEPLEAENVKLRGLVVALKEEGDRMYGQLIESRGANARAFVMRVMNDPKDSTWDIAMKVNDELERCVKSWDAAKSQGFTPTNTTDK